MNLKYLIPVLVTFMCVTIANAQWIQIGQDIDGEAANNYFGGAISINSDGTIIASGAEWNDGNGTSSGHVRVFKNINDAWIQIGEDIEGETAEDRSGESVSLSSDGTVVAIGASRNGGNGIYSGHVRIYENINDSWVQIGADIDGEAELDHSGSSVSLSANGFVVAIGAIENDGNGTASGHVRVYENINGTWTQIGQDIDGEYPFSRSGHAVSLNEDGSVIAIGSPKNNGNGNEAGHVRMYKNINNTWTQVGEDIDGVNAYDHTGWAVSLNSDGSIVAIGSPRNNGNGPDAGNVRVFQNIAGTWTQIGQNLIGEAEYNFFGQAVSLNSDGSIVAIGAPANDGNGTASGHVRIYQNINGLWVQSGLTILGEAAGDVCGQSVSVSDNGSVVAIGAHLNDGNGSKSGHVRVFRNPNLGIHDLFSGDISFYPNPTKGEIHFEAIDLSTAKVFVYDSTGKLLRNWQISEINGQTRIDMSSFESGIYIVEIQEKGRLRTVKIIKE